MRDRVLTQGAAATGRLLPGEARFACCRGREVGGSMTACSLWVLLGKVEGGMQAGAAREGGMQARR